MTVEEGVSLDGLNTTGVAAALAAVQAAQQVVLMLGIGNGDEHEGHDRTSTTLPGVQEAFAQKVLALGKPTVLVLVNGGIVSIDSLKEKASAIVEAFYPSTRGGEALYMQLSGQSNRWSKLPVTIYDSKYTSQVGLDDFTMAPSANGPGRTYRFFTGQPLWRFGSGLSFTTFKVSCTSSSSSVSEAAPATGINCVVKNTGKRAGDEVLMLMHRFGSPSPSSWDSPVPLKSLIDFGRVSVDAGASATMAFSVPQASLALTTGQGDRVVLAGTHYLEVFTNGTAPVESVKVQVASEATIEVVPRP